MRLHRADPGGGDPVPEGGDNPGVPERTRLWAAPLGPVDDPEAGVDFKYFANPFWQTGPLQPSQTQTLPLRHVFQTPELVAGVFYKSGRDWIGDPGQATDQPSLPGDYARRVASGGTWPLSRFNLDMPDRCGLNVAFVVDVSSSVASPNARPELVQAMNAFVDALHGTPSRIALFTFGTDSPANGFPVNTGCCRSGHEPRPTRSSPDTRTGHLSRGRRTSPTGIAGWLPQPKSTQI